MKWALYSFLVLVMALHVAGAQTFYFEGNETVNVGDITILSLYVNTSVALGSIQLEIYFDPNILQAEGVTFTASNGIFEKTIDNSTGKITIGAISLTGIGSGKLADVFFRGVSAGYSPLNISIVDLTDTGNNYLQGHSINASILVLTADQSLNASQQILYFNITPGTKLIYVWNNTLYNPNPVIENITLTELQIEPWSTVRYFFDFDNSGGAFGHYDIVMADGYFQKSGWHTTSQGGFGSLPLPLYGGFKYYISPPMMFPTNASAGQSWVGEDNLYGYPLTYSSLVEKFENITTPAGTFYCAKIITYINSTDSFINGTRTMWIGEPGLVKLIYNHSDGSVTRLELAEISAVQLPLEIINVSVAPGNGYVDVNLTWVGDGAIMLGPINFTAFDYVYINATTPTTETFRLDIPLNAPSDYYFVHVVDRDRYFHFGDRVYVENSAMPLLTIPSTTVVVNSTAEIPVFLSTPVNVTGINFTLHYNPSIMQIDSYSPTVPSTSFANVDNINGTAKFAIIFNDTVSGYTVPVLNITVRATSIGITDLSVTGVEISLTDFSPMPAVAMNGTLTVIGQKGDIDGDGKVTIGDITNLAWMLFGKVQQDSKADFNGNGRVDIGDLAKLAYYVLGKISEL